MDPDRPSADREPTLRDYLDVLLKHWLLITAAAVIAFATALGFSLGAPPVYRGSTTVVVDRGSATLGLVPDITGVSQQAFVDTLAEIVKSRAVAERALDRLGVPPDRSEETLQRYTRGLRVTRVRGTDLIRIEAEGPSPEAAAENVNAIAAAFLDWNVESRRRQAAAGREFIEGQLVGVSAELRGAENALAQYKAQGGQVSLSEQTSLAVTKLAEFEAQRRAAVAELQSVEASLRQARKALAQQQATIPSSFVRGEDPVVGQLRSELARIEVELVGLREQFTDQHPQVIALRARIAEVQNRLRRQGARALLSETLTLNPIHQNMAAEVIRLEIQEHTLRAREAALAVTVARYNQDVQTLPPKEIQLARLTRDMKVAEGTYLLLSEKLQETKIAEASIVGDLRVVDRAVPPTSPVRPRTRLNALLGLLVGLMVGVGGAFVRESLETTFRTPDEAGQALGLPLLAIIPVWNPNGRPPNKTPMPLVMAKHGRTPFAEAFRHLRTNLLYSSPDRPLHTLLVTSPGGGEGKGTVAANLAIAFTQVGQRVGLVECDLRRPGLSWAFQPQGTGGLTEMLVDGLPADQALHPTKVENLWFIPGGTIPPNPAELLGSQKMRTFLGQGRPEVDLLVLDAPPVLPVTDATVLAPAADGVILVIDFQKTPREAARATRQRLDAVGARVLGLVVNAVPGRGRGGYYYYQYYQYSHYYDAEPEEAGPTPGKPKT